MLKDAGILAFTNSDSAEMSRHSRSAPPSAGPSPRAPSIARTSPVDGRDQVEQFTAEIALH